MITHKNGFIAFRVVLWTEVLLQYYG